MLTAEQIAFYHENGYIRLEGVFDPEELRSLSDELDYVIQNFANWGAAWRGPWREKYLTAEEDRKATLVAIHELQHYSAAWGRAIYKPALVDSLSQLLDHDCVEFHHMTLHAKPPDAGAPFPLHQDLPFYPHEDGRYLDTLFHLDDSTEESGCIRFLPGSHKLGKLQHILGPETSPHLPMDEYRLEDSVSVPAKAGDVIVFSIWTVHGSNVNNSGRWRRLVRVGFRHPENFQVGGQAMGRPGVVVRGVRPKLEGQEIDVYGNWSQAEAE
jgi:phytanoyl-CoA hydroxylase